MALATACELDKGRPRLPRDNTEAGEGRLERDGWGSPCRSPLNKPAKAVQRFPRAGVALGAEGEGISWAREGVRYIIQFRHFKAQGPCAAHQTSEPPVLLRKCPSVTHHMNSVRTKPGHRKEPLLGPVSWCGVGNFLRLFPGQRRCYN